MFSTQRWKHLEYASDGWLHIDSEMRILWCSHVTTKLLNGVEAETELLNRSLLQLLRAPVVSPQDIADGTELNVLFASAPHRICLRFISLSGDQWLVCARPEQDSLREILLTRDAERKAISQRLHDDVGAQLVALRMEAEILSSQPEPPTKADFTRLIQGISNTVELVSAMSRTLHPTYLEQLGLEEAVRYHAEVIAQATHCELKIATTTIPLDLEPDIALLIYRLVCTLVTRERLVDASWSMMAMHCSPTTIILEMSDNGRSIDSQQHTSDGDTTWLEINRRLISLRGEYHCESPEQTGLRLKVIVPRVAQKVPALPRNIL